jgi:hypothetical protein
VIQEIEDATGVAFDPQRIAVPPLARDDIREGFDVEVILYVDAEDVGHSRLKFLHFIELHSHVEIRRSPPAGGNWHPNPLIGV